MLDAAYPRGALNYWKSNFLSSLSDEAIRTMIYCFAQSPTPMGQLLIEHFHGAVTRIASPTPHFRIADGYNLLVLSEWMDTKDNAAYTAWVRDSFAAMRPFMGSSRYVNYLADDEHSDAVAASYGPNYRRLQQLKGKYDPDNFFRMNHNIRPVL
jgi:FAD/FMN-containing dehydrogenase